MANIKELANTYMSYNTLDEALLEIRNDTIHRIEETLDRLDNYDAVDLLKIVNDEFHTMDELDDVFDYMSVTSILEELREIDTSDEYFNADSKTSGDDPWVIADVCTDDLAKQIYEGDVDIYEADVYDDIDDIMREEETLVRMVTDKFKIYDKARALFEQVLQEDPKAVITALWNINQD